MTTLEERGQSGHRTVQGISCLECWYSCFFDVSVSCPCKTSKINLNIRYPGAPLGGSAKQPQPEPELSLLYSITLRISLRYQFYHVSNRHRDHRRSHPRAPTTVLNKLRPVPHKYSPALNSNLRPFYFRRPPCVRGNGTGFIDEAVH